MRRLSLVLMVCALQGCVAEEGVAGASAVARTELPQCEPAQLLGRVPEPGEVEAHRKFTLPTVDYPHGTRKDMWGLSVTLRVDEAGTPVCFKVSEAFGEKVPLDAQRKALISSLGGWRYIPLMRGGRAVPMVVTEPIREQELPGPHVPLPSVPLSKVRIVLARSGCFGTCPSYLVELRGDGSVRYKGGGFVDVEGEHNYQVPAAEVAALVDSLRAKDLWSMQPSYRAGITDNPTYELVIDMGGQVRRIEDYVGAMAGMPAAISEFEDEVDKIARSANWVKLSGEAIDRLQEEGFAFDSQAGADLLARAVTNDDGHDDAAMARLIELGAPIEGAKLDGWMRAASPVPLIESALRQRRVVLIDPLVAAGALKTGGHFDQGKIDAAFRAAIEGGNLAAVQAIWGIAGTKRHPGLTFVDQSEIDDGEPVRKEAPVTLLLSGRYLPKSEWQGFAIARWLVAQGCDIKATRANGDTLLHIAAEANDVAFVRYLLDQGLDPSASGEFGLPPLGGTQNEDVALLLLQAGTDLRMMDGDGQRFLNYARDNHWGRVVARLQRQEVTGD
ncbi:MAG: ankyrin repeat domain-containing protein [Luteimonas sp.]|nr:ankyrin repeat domain-containing protein [Luteimonas sp.]